MMRPKSSAAPLIVYTCEHVLLLLYFVFEKLPSSYFYSYTKRYTHELSIEEKCQHNYTTNFICLVSIIKIFSVFIYEKILLFIKIL